MPRSGCGLTAKSLPKCSRLTTWITVPFGAVLPWTSYEIVLDVPEGASLITFGLLQTGRGQAWVDEIQLEIVDRAIPYDRLGGRGPGAEWGACAPGVSGGAAADLDASARGPSVASEP